MIHDSYLYSITLIARVENSYEHYLKVPNVRKISKKKMDLSCHAAKFRYRLSLATKYTNNLKRAWPWSLRRAVMARPVPMMPHVHDRAYFSSSPTTQIGHWEKGIARWLPQPSLPAIGQAILNALSQLPPMHRRQRQRSVNIWKVPK